jgi:hypothetical protein
VVHTCVHTYECYRMTEGVMKIHFKKRGEIYACTWPNVYGRGIIFGRLLMEMGVVDEYTDGQSVT